MQLQIEQHSVSFFCFISTKVCHGARPALKGPRSSGDWQSIALISTFDEDCTREGTSQRQCVKLEMQWRAAVDLQPRLTTITDL